MYGGFYSTSCNWLLISPSALNCMFYPQSIPRANHFLPSRGSPVVGQFLIPINLCLTFSSYPRLVWGKALEPVLICLSHEVLLPEKVSFLNSRTLPSPPRAFPLSDWLTTGHILLKWTFLFYLGFVLLFSLLASWFIFVESMGIYVAIYFFSE